MKQFHVSRLSICHLERAYPVEITPWKKQVLEVRVEWIVDQFDENIWEWIKLVDYSQRAFAVFKYFVFSKMALKLFSKNNGFGPFTKIEFHFWKIRSGQLFHELFIFQVRSFIKSGNIFISNIFHFNSSSKKHLSLRQTHPNPSLSAAKKC